VTRVLVVDDKPESLYLLRTLLTGHGCDAVEARHGAEALVKARQQPPDLVISDLLMPVMDGYTLLRHWKADARLARIPFIVYTATYTDPQDEQLALDLGADAFIVKPTEPDAFMARLHEVLARAQAGDMESHPPAVESEAQLERYTETLVRKLEEKRFELERANLDLADKEASYRQMFESHPYPMWVYDLESLRFLAVNAAAVAHYGYSREEFLAMTIRDIRPPEDVPALLEAVAEVTQGLSPTSVWRHRRRDGSVISVEISSHTITFDGRRGELVLARDITARLEAEAALRESTLRLRLAVEAANIGLWDWDLRTDAVYYSPEWKRQIGYRDDEVANTLEEWSSRVHPDDFEPAVRRASGFIQNPVGRHEVEFRFRHRDGSYRWIYAQGDLLRDSSGRPVRMLGCHVDITARKQAESRISHLNRVYAVLSGINETIVRETDPDAMLARACQIAVERGGFLMAWIGLRDDASGRLRIRAQTGANLETLYILTRLIEGEPPAGCAFTNDALETGRSSVCDDVALDPRASAWRDAALERQYRSMAAFPLKAGDRAIGTFNLYSGEADAFDAEEVALLNDLAADISFALEISRRELEHRAAEARIAAQRAALIALTSQRTRDPADEPALLREIVESAARTLDVERVSLWRYTADRTAIECVDLFELSAGRHTSGARLTASTYPRYFAAIGITDVIVADDALTHPHTREFADAYLAPLGIHSMLDAPTRIGGVRDGVLCHEHVGTTRQWTEDEKTFAVAMANLVSLTLEAAERRRAEAKLGASEDRFRELAESIQDVFWITDVEKQRMFYVSPAYEAVWGRTCDSLYQSPRTWVDAIHPDDRNRVQQAAITKQATGEFEEEYRVVRPDGSERWVRDVAFPVRSAAGRVERIVGVARDITERRQLGEQLRQSQKLEAVGRLAGGVAHDVNNILSVITLQAELTAMTANLPPEVREGLEEVRAAARRGADLTRQLLLFSRRQVMQLRDLDLNDVVISLAKMLQRIIGEDVRLHLDLHSAPLTTRADAGMLDQVLMNLGVNARDAMPRGGQVIISTGEAIFDASDPRRSPDAEPGRYVRLTVRDTGIGMTPEVLSHIFEPFFTTKESGRGTGLGLATVFGIVKQHHGWIDVQSRPGEGSQFDIFVPALAAAEAPARPARAEPRGGTETILVVEDDQLVRMLTCAMLERHGYRVLEASDGAEAMRVWREHAGQVALLLTDLVMPGGMGGQQLARQLQEERPGLEVVFTSGYSGDIAGRELSLRSGENFLQKPCTADQLLAAVRRSLDA
jgi:PAS domain S-box-containing protein